MKLEDRYHLLATVIVSMILLSLSLSFLLLPKKNIQRKRKQSTR